MKRLEKAIFAESQQVDGEALFSHCQGDVLTDDLPSGIKRANDVF